MDNTIQVQKDLYTLHHHLVNSLYRAGKNGKLAPIAPVLAEYKKAQQVVATLKDKYAFMPDTIEPFNKDNAKKLLVVTDALLLDSIRTTSTTADLTDSESFLSSISSAPTTKGTDSIPSTIDSIISSFTKKIDEPKNEPDLNIDNIIASFQSLSNPSSTIINTDDDIKFDLNTPLSDASIDATITALNEMVTLGGTCEFASPELKTHIIENASREEKQKWRHFVITGYLRCINGILIPPILSDINHILIPKNNNQPVDRTNYFETNTVINNNSTYLKMNSIDGIVHKQAANNNPDFIKLSNNLTETEITDIRRRLNLDDFCNTPSPSNIQPNLQSKSGVGRSSSRFSKGGTRKIRPQLSTK